MPLIPFLGGSKLKAARLNEALDETRTKRQKADQTRNNSTVLLSSADLVFPVEANTWYTVDCWLHWQSNPTADIKFGWLMPAGSGGTWSTIGPDVVQAPLVGAERINYTDFSTESMGIAKPNAGDDTNTGVLFICNRAAGIFVTGPTAGNLTLQFAQNTANASDTKLKIGSWMRLTKVA